MKPETKSLLIQVVIAAGISIVTIGIMLNVYLIVSPLANIPTLTPDQFADASGPVPLSGLIPILICIIVVVGLLAVIKPHMPNEYDDMEPKKK